MISRRRLLASSLGTLSAGAIGFSLPPWSLAAEDRASFDIKRLKDGYLRRLAAVRKAGGLPVIDIESSYNPPEIDLKAFVASMDRASIALMALSVDQPDKLVNKGETWGDGAFTLNQAYPEYFIPVGNGGGDPAWTRNGSRFLDDNERHIVADGYPLMGEFEFRHYPSPREIKRNGNKRDVDIPIDGPEGHRLFAFAEKTGIPFQIHYEIEDRLLPPLETILERYPGATVIWCHAAQIRYQERSARYNAAYLRDLFVKHPNLHVDTAFGDPESVYQPSHQNHARIWDGSNDIKAEWKDLIVEFPYRFHAALDIGGDRMTRVEEWNRTLRRFLACMPEPARDIVAYGASWKLLFGEEIVV